MRKIAFFLLLAFITTGVYAQIPVTFGPKVGVASSKLKTDIADVKEEMKTGFEVGAFVRVKIKKFYIQPELYYAVKGGDLSLTLSDSSIRQEIQLNTLDIPVLFGYRIIDNKLFNFRIMAGPVASFIVNKTITINGSQIADDLVDKSLKDAIWGAQFGIGIDVLIFAIDFRYELGFNDISDDSGNTMKSNGFHLSLGWKIL